jgi:hypothetical protein
MASSLMALGRTVQQFSLAAPSLKPPLLAAHLSMPPSSNAASIGATSLVFFVNAI